MHNKNKFDEMMIQIHNYLFDLQLCLAGFVCEILDELSTDSYDLDIEFPLLDNENYSILKCSKITLDKDSEKLLVTINDDSDKVIDWIDLDVTVQERIAGEIHNGYLSEIIYRQLKEENIDHLN